MKDKTLQNREKLPSIEKKKIKKYGKYFAGSKLFVSFEKGTPAHKMTNLKYQLAQHCIGIAGIMGANPIQGFNFILLML